MANRENPFKVPENYFEELEKNILSQVKKNPKKKYFFYETKTVYKYAATLLLLLALGGVIWWSLPTNTINNSTTQLAKTTIKDTKIEETQPIKEIVKERKEERKSIIAPPIEEAQSISSASTIQQIKEDSTNDGQKLTEEELQYLEYYLQGDIINDYLTYNSTEK